MDEAGLMRNLFVSIVTALYLCLVPGLIRGQGQTPARQISGQVVIGGEPAPAGLPVLLTIATRQDAAARDNFPVARALTDAAGKFVVEHLEGVGSDKGKEICALSSHFPAYQDGLML